MEILVSLFFVLMAFWRKEGFLNVLTGILLLFTGLSCLSDYLVIGLVFMFLTGYFWSITIAALFGVRD